MKGKRKKVQHFFVYIAMLVMSGFLIMGGLQQLSMTHELKSSIVQKEKKKKNCLLKRKNWRRQNRI